MTERPETMAATNAVALLMRQHEEIRRLFRKVESNTGARRADAFDRLRRLLSVHETAEEEVVHPLIRPNAPRVVEARLEEERRIKRMLRELERMGTSDPSFPPMFARFRTAVLEHASLEERAEFPMLRRRGDAELRGLAAAIKAAEAMAPTHPHPGVESPLRNLIVGSFAAVIDRVRDVFRR